MPDPTPCQHVHCEEPATAHIAVPSSVPGLDDLVMPYCETHAAGIIGDRWTFPGARRVTVLHHA